jgi:hypothetical protein
LFSTLDGTLLAKLPGHWASVNDVAWSPLHGGILASASDDGTVRLWATHRWPVVNRGIELRFGTNCVAACESNGDYAGAASGRTNPEDAIQFEYGTNRDWDREVIQPFYPFGSGYEVNPTAWMGDDDDGEDDDEPEEEEEEGDDDGDDDDGDDPGTDEDEHDEESDEDVE